jgi:N6-L-threonylcarbamoyladenine synthase
VAANESLRSAMVARSPVRVHCPPLELCTDNAAMVASIGFFRYSQGERADSDLDVVPGLRLAEEPSA